MKKLIVRVVECSDYDETYGLLIIKRGTFSIKEVQNKIYEIKNNEEFLKENPNWTIEDVFVRFPSDWEWEFIKEDGIVEI